MSNRMAVRPPLRDWRWWVLWAVLTAVAFIGGGALVRAGVDSGAAGALATLPLIALSVMTLRWRQRALNVTR